MLDYILKYTISIILQQPYINKLIAKVHFFADITTLLNAKELILSAILSRTLL